MLSRTLHCWQWRMLLQNVVVGPFEAIMRKQKKKTNVVVVPVAPQKGQQLQHCLVR